MSELSIIQGLQDVIQATASFSDSEVTIEDWGILDEPGAVDGGPKLVLRMSDNFDSLQDAQSWETTWQIAALLYQPWDDDWPTTRQAAGATRQVILDAFNSVGTNARSAGGIEGVDVRRIYALTPFEQDTRDMYTYMVQVIGFEVVEMHA